MKFKEEDYLAFEAPITEVTVMEDRAQVLRHGRVTLATGRNLIRPPEISPVVIDKTVLVRLSGASVTDCQVVRKRIYLSHEGPEKLRELLEIMRTLREELIKLGQAVERVESELSQLHTLRSQALDQVAEDASWNDADVARWAGWLESLAAREEKLIGRKVALEAEKAERLAEEERLNDRLKSERHAAFTEGAWLAVDVSAETAGELEVSIEYLVANACWRPWHAAEWLSPTRARFTSRGCVWQNTGEDWPEVRLTFSTERPSLGSTPPRLGEDLLHIQPKSDAVFVEEREEEIHDAGKGQERERPQRLPGIDDGGSIQQLEAGAPATIPTTGRPLVVDLFEFESDCLTDLVCVPELRQAVLQRSQMTQAADHPLLAGPVDLIRNAGLMGRTRILFVAPGERFELCWGPDTDLRAHRRVDVHEEKAKILSSWTEQRHEIEIRLTNLGLEEKVINLTERIPVSEIEKVEVKLLKNTVTEGKTPDENGFLKWELRLPAQGRKSVRVEYSMLEHPKVVR